MPDRIRHWACNVSYKPVPANVRDMSSGDEPIAVHRGCATVQSVTVTAATITTTCRSQSTISACFEARSMILGWLLEGKTGLRWRL